MIKINTILIVLLYIFTLSINTSKAQSGYFRSSKEILNVDLYLLLSEDTTYKMTSIDNNFYVFKKDTPSFFVIISFTENRAFKGMAVNFKNSPIYNQHGYKISEVLISGDIIDAFSWFRVMTTIDTLRNTQIKDTEVR